MTPYEKVFDSFKRRIEDKDLPTFEEDEQIEMLTGWLDTAIGYIELEQLQMVSDLSDRDNDSQVFVADLKNFEIEVIAMYMAAAWYEPKINSLEHTLLFVGASGEKWTDQDAHMKMMKAIRDDWKLEARKHFRNYGYKKNSYLENT